MSDIRCAVCGEAWDTYHLRHDAPAWVRPLFMSGAGCEACEGVPPDSQADDRDATAILTHIADRVTSPDDDDVDAGTGIDLSPRMRPKWSRPADVQAWDCDSCSVRVMRDQDERDGHPAAFYVERMKSTLTYHEDRVLGIHKAGEGRFSSLTEALDTISSNGSDCKLCVRKCNECECCTSSYELYPYPGEYGGPELCMDCHGEQSYEMAIESFDGGELARVLGYEYRSPVNQWFKERITLDMMDSTGLDWEDNDGGMVYSGAQRLEYKTRDEKAKVLRALHRLAGAK